MVREGWKLKCQINNEVVLFGVEQILSIRFHSELRNKSLFGLNRLNGLTFKPSTLPGIGKMPSINTIMYRLTQSTPTGIHC